LLDPSAGRYSGFAIVPCSFLYLRSVELAFKACIVSHGVSQPTIRKKYGHSLERLHAAITELDPQFPERAPKDPTGIITQFSSFYAEKGFEYPSNIFTASISPQGVVEFAHAFVEFSRRYRFE
jgi:hypothetical protein